LLAERLNGALAVFHHVADRHDADQLTFSTTGGC
jgi:hypothetical protein